MEKIVYLYGSGRAADTRTLRHGNFPREMQVRIGPWIVRPSRRTAVEVDKLAPHLATIVTKIEHGVIKVQKGDGSDISIDELKTFFADAPPDYSAMSQAELLSILRATPSLAVLKAVVLKTPKEDRQALIGNLRPVLERLDQTNRAGLEALGRELSSEIEEDDRDPGAGSTEIPERSEPVADPKSEEPKALIDDPESMSFNDFNAAPAVGTATTEPAPPETDDVVAGGGVNLGSESAPEPVAVEEEVKGAIEGRELPEGWRALSNAKLQDLITEKGIAMPEKKNKTGLTEALEAWLAGGS